MSAVTVLPAPLDGWTVDDLQSLPEDDTARVELVDGGLLVTPPPALRHTYAVAELVAVLRGSAPDELVVLAEGGLALDRRNLRIPDVLVVRREALGQQYATPADLVLAVEVVSPRSVSTDRVAKPAQYAAAQIPAYWRLELEESLLVVHALDGDAYRETGRYDGRAALEQPFPVALDVRDLLV